MMADEGEVQDAPTEVVDAGEGLGGQADAELRADPSIDVEGLARSFGWSPKEAWRGDPGDWTPATEFLNQAAKIHKRTREDLKLLRKSTDRMGRMVERLASDKFETMKAQWQAKHAEAVEAGDVAGAEKAGRKLVEIEREQAEAASTPEQDFAEANPWYGKHPEATDFAVATSARLAREGKGIEAQLDAVSAAVRKRFPELFEDGGDAAEDERPAQRRKAPPSVHDTGSRASAGMSREKGWNDIPTADRIVMEREFVAKGLVTDKKELARIYFEENGQ